MRGGLDGKRYPGSHRTSALDMSTGKRGDILLRLDPLVLIQGSGHQNADSLRRHRNRLFLLTHHLRGEG